MGYQFELSTAGLDILAEDLGFTGTRFPFEIRSVGATLDERAGIREALWQQLNSIGLARGYRLEPEVEQGLRLYGHASMEAVLVAGGTDGFRLRARAGAGREAAVLAVGAGEQLRFELLRSTEVAAALVRLLPAAPAGSGQPVTVPVGGPPSPASPEDQQTMLVGVRPTASQTAVRAAQELFASPRPRYGQFSVSGAGAAAEVLPWFDTASGRYLAVTGSDGMGQETVTYQPVDGHRLLRELNQRVTAILEP
ncbi:ESAT-6 protein secretion system EspG family protein [Tamaricihabitans halophyticus]|uniref:ESAT-6 protein secretion system EspG family protein n=1 Tax=Tamaricihabitans halophyticus TaxID=1262583 RepID=A0A4R2QVQ5_9PSEU|nr:ESX secretion-associated protein EspG [Tamaricihabitans halophyticus]TCP54162.1 ESAT-6 protein secretion system EspG family protein [Tamaricihabitans halophyticus]